MSREAGQENAQEFLFFMTSVSSASTRSSVSDSSLSVGPGESILKIVGLACWVGFLVDIAVIAFPLSFGNIEWRVGMLQQIGDRSILLLLGSACLIFANLNVRKLRKPITLISMAAGVFFLLSSIIAIRDGSAINKRASEAINSQASVVQEQLDKAKEDASLAPTVTPEQMKQAERELKIRTDALQKQAKLGTLKKSSSSVGNLLVTGFGLIALGRVGARSKRRS